MILQQASNNSVCYCSWYVQPNPQPGVNLRGDCGAFYSNMTSSLINKYWNTLAE